MPLVLMLCVLAVPKPKLAVMPLSGSHLHAETVTILGDVLTQALYDRDVYQITTAADVNAVLGLEKMKDAVGCTSSTCLAEIGGALGVDYMLNTSVGRLGGELILTLNLLRVRGQQAPVRVQVTVADDERLYRQAADKAVGELLGRDQPRVLKQAALTVPAVVEKPKPPTSTKRKLAIASTVVGSIAAAVGTVVLLFAPSPHDAYVDYKGSPDDEHYRRVTDQIDAHNRVTGAGAATTALGAALIATGIALFASGAP